MKSRPAHRIRLGSISLLALFAGSLFGNPPAATAADSGGSVPPQPIQLPPGPPAGGAEGYGVAGSSRFLVIGRPVTTVQYNGTNIDNAGNVLVWELDEGYLVDDLVKKRFWVIDALKPVYSHFFGTEVAAGDRWIAVTGGQSRGGFGSSGTPPPKTNHVQLIEFPPDGGWLPGPELPGPADSIYRRTRLFGISLAMHRNRLVVGSTDGALVYEVDSAGVWTRTQILNTNSAAWSSFGTAVAIHEGLIAVGAPSSPNTDTNGLIAGQGGVIIYRRGQNGLYVVEKELRLASGPPRDAFDSRDAFGTSLALEVRNGIEWLAVGVPGRNAQISTNSFQPDAGSAALYRRILPNGEWTFHQEITNYFGNQLTQDAKSGNTIALSNGRLAVGAIAAGGGQVPPAYGVVGFYYYDEDQDRWIRTGEKVGSPGTPQYGLGLHGFEHGFLIGAPFGGNWEWRPTDPYVAFINSGSGPAFAGTPAHDRRADGDPDGDGLINADEFFFGTPPLTANTNRVFTPTNDVTAKLFKLQWQQSSNTFGLTSAVAWSSNMFAGNWTTNGVQIVDLGAVPGAAARRYEARLSTVGRTNVYFRLLVE